MTPGTRDLAVHKSDDEGHVLRVREQPLDTDGVRGRSNHGAAA